MILLSSCINQQDIINSTLMKIALISYLVGASNYSKLDSERIIYIWDAEITVSNKNGESECDPPINFQMKGIPNIFKTTKFGPLQENRLIEIQKPVFDTLSHSDQISQEKQIFHAFSSPPAIKNKDHNYREAIALYMENRSVDRFLLSYSKNPPVKLVPTRS